MTTAMQLSALVVAATAALLSPAAPPRCIADLISGESGARPHIRAPVVAPGRGRTGTALTVRGGGFEPGTRLTIAAVYGGNGCVIEGLGDQYLTSARADGRGSYAVSVHWPSTFDPVLGRNEIGTRALPHGAYYVFALPCAARAACSFTSGTQPGGPFVLGQARAAPVVWIVAGLAAAGALLGGLIVRRRAPR